MKEGYKHLWETIGLDRLMMAIYSHIKREPHERRDERAEEARRVLPAMAGKALDRLRTELDFLEWQTIKATPNTTPTVDDQWLQIALGRGIDQESIIHNATRAGFATTREYLEYCDQTYRHHTMNETKDHLRKKRGTR